MHLALNLLGTGLGPAFGAKKRFFYFFRTGLSETVEFANSKLDLTDPLSTKERGVVMRRNWVRLSNPITTRYDTPFFQAQWVRETKFAVRKFYRFA